MIHDHKFLHWNQNQQAECVVCGDIVEGRYIPNLTGWFTPEQLDEFQPPDYTMNKTFTLAPIVRVSMRDYDEI